ncbi:MAG: hypothetical protein ACYTGQ_07605 [Planctomycetota bacterium]|jgi:hypothetical protein
MQNVQDQVQRWHTPLSDRRATLRSALDSLSGFALEQSDIPTIVQFVENPRFEAMGLGVFHGAADLHTHDCIHILLGRGLLAKDEAFVIGFTMGSTKLVTTTEQKLYTFFAKRLYPGVFRFTDDDARVFKDATKLGGVSDCAPLPDADYEPLMDLPLPEARRELGIEEDLLRAYYHIEKRRYPNAPESQRLLT